MAPKGKKQKRSPISTQTTFGTQSALTPKYEDSSRVPKAGLGQVEADRFEPEPDKPQNFGSLANGSIPPDDNYEDDAAYQANQRHENLTGKNPQSEDEKSSHSVDDKGKEYENYEEKYSNDSLQKNSDQEKSNNFSNSSPARRRK